MVMQNGSEFFGVRAALLWLRDESDAKTQGSWSNSRIA